MENIFGQWIAEIIRKSSSAGSGSMAKKDSRLIKCKGCENTFPESLNKRWCSGSCYQKNRRARRLNDREYVKCSHCGDYFLPTSRINKLCSARCQAENKKLYFEKRWAKYRDRRKKLKPKRANCKYCGVSFEVTKPNRLFCSKDCRNLNRVRPKTEKLFEWSATMRTVTEADITRSQFSEELRVFKKAGKKIVSFPEVESSAKEFTIEGQDSDSLAEDLDQFYNVNKGTK